jgi:hypothetical protein
MDSNIESLANANDARFKLVKAKADISNENKSVKRFDKVGDNLGRIDLGAKRLGGETSCIHYEPSSISDS